MMKKHFCLWSSWYGAAKFGTGSVLQHAVVHLIHVLRDLRGTTLQRQLRSEKERDSEKQNQSSKSCWNGTNRKDCTVVDDIPCSWGSRAVCAALPGSRCRWWAWGTGRACLGLPRFSWQWCRCCCSEASLTPCLQDVKQVLKIKSH